MVSVGQHEVRDLKDEQSLSGGVPLPAKKPPKARFLWLLGHLECCPQFPAVR